MDENQELKNILSPTSCLLLVWDVQNRLVHTIFNKDAFLERTRYIIEVAHEKRVPVVFSRITPLPENFESPVRKFLYKNRFANMPQVPNPLDLTILPGENDMVIPKNTASMFIGTNFELLLRNAGITTILLTGIATEMGIESTARDAGNRGFFPVIIHDAVSSSDEAAHNRSLENMKKMMILMSTEELLTFWKQ